jgi:hypothetical protein
MHVRAAWLDILLQCMNGGYMTDDKLSFSFCFQVCSLCYSLFGFPTWHLASLATSMFLVSILFFLLLALSAKTQIQHAVSTCPAVWDTISHELTTAFLSNNTCNDDARAAIRAAFHDCFPKPGCDGSLFLANSELSRSENVNLGPTTLMLGTLAEKHKVTVADMIQFAAGKISTTSDCGSLVIVAALIRQL